MQGVAAYPRLNLELSLNPLQHLSSCRRVCDMRKLLTYPLQLMYCLHAPQLPKHSATV